MGIRLAHQIVDGDKPLVGIIIHYRLISEVGIVILGVQFQRLTKHRDIESRAQSIVPSLLLLEVFADIEVSATCQEVVVLSQGKHRAIALACRQADADGIDRRILQVETRGEEAAIKRTMVETDTCHRCQLRA